MAKTPIPFMPFTLWRWLFIKRANQHWRSLGAVNQVGEEELLAQPYAEVESKLMNNLKTRFSKEAAKC